MMDKVQKIRKEVERLHGNPYYMMAVKDVLAIIDSIQEPVSEDLKKAADNALESISDQYDIISVGSCFEMFRLGAEWKEKQMMIKAVKTTFNVSLPSGLYDKLWIKGCKNGDKLLVIKKDEL